MNKKVAFHTLSKIVDSMYDFSLVKVEEIDKRCLDIQDVVTLSGWDLDDFIREMMGYNNPTT